MLRAMYLRVVRVQLVPGKFNDYWSWASEIVALWDDYHVIRVGGPYRHRGPAGEDIAIWLTAHETEAAMRDEFRDMYASERGAALIARRPPLVAETTTAAYADWDGTIPPPETPSLA
jgi:hypothetical protein